MKKIFTIAVLASLAAVAGHHGPKIPHRDLYVGMDIASFVLDILTPRTTVVQETVETQVAPVAVQPIYVAPPSIPEVTYVQPGVVQQTYVAPQVVQPMTTTTTYVYPAAPRYVSPFAGGYYYSPHGLVRGRYGHVPPPPPRHMRPPFAPRHMGHPMHHGGPGRPRH